MSRQRLLRASHAKTLCSVANRRIPQLEQLEGRELLAYAIGSSFAGAPSYVYDIDGDVGPQEYADISNVQLRVYDKATGALEASPSLSQFWTAALGTSSGGFDPRIQYDHDSGKWFAISARGSYSPDSALLLAVSETSNPGGAWKGISIKADPESLRWIDYPYLGLDGNAVYVRASLVAISTSDTSKSVLYSIPKADLLLPAPSAARITRIDSDFYTPPVDPHGSTDDALLVNSTFAFWQADCRQTVQSTFTPLDGSNTGIATVLPDKIYQLTEVTGLTECTAPNAASGGRQPGTTHVLGNNFGDYYYRNGNYLYFAGSFRYLGARAIYWAKINLPTQSMVDIGFIGDADHDYLVPSIGANANGDVVIGYSRSGPAEYLSAYASVGQLNQAGQLNFSDPILLKTGNEIYDATGPAYGSGNARWSDYSTSVNVDPANPNAFWVTAGYVATRNLASTWIAQIGVRNEPPVVDAAGFSLPENSANGTIVGDATATDPDPGTSLTWAITGGNAGGAFAINNSGRITVATSAALDLETNPVFSLTVTATDNGVPAMSGSNSITVSLTNVNESPTNIALSNATLAENVAAAVVGDITVSDPDAGDTHTLTVSDSRFEVVSGQLQLKSGQSLNFETTPAVSVIITARDAGNRTFAKSFVLTVTNVNESPTNITLANASVAENQTGGVVGAVSVSDPDAGATHSFTVTDSRFEVVSGQLRLKAGQSLDFETEPAVNLTITATDSGGLEFAKGFAVASTNVNEAPTNITLGNASVAENQLGAVVGTVTVSDPDVGNTHSFTVSDTRFEVVGGQLRLKAGQSLNFEAEPTVNLSITATDAGGLALAKGFTLAVTNVNEAPTNITLANALVAENQSGGVVGAVGVSDPDVGDTHTFTVSDNRFEVVGGQLRLKAGQSLNFEAEPTVNLSITATDAGGLALAKGFTLSTTNVNEAPTNISLANASLPENQLGAVVGTVSVSDPDAGNTHTFIVSDNRFEVVGAQLRLKAGQSLNFETEPTVNLSITATDAGGLALAKGFTISTTNVNESPTNITLANASVAENQSGGVVGAVSVSDPDAGDSHTFLVSDTRFEVVGGQLRLKAGQSLNFEAEPMVTVSITATDSGGLTQLRGFSLTTTNVNEAPTNITLGNSTVTENQVNATVGAVSVSDPETGDTHTFAVSDTRFEIAGGQLRLKAGQSLDFETEPTVNLTIAAMDSGGLALAKDFTLTVLDAFGWHNAVLAEDVDDSGAVGNMDAFVLIAELRLTQSRPLPEPDLNTFPPPYWDVYADNFLSNNDVFVVIAYLRQVAQSGEGESPIPVARGSNIASSTLMELTSPNEEFDGSSWATEFPDPTTIQADTMLAWELARLQFADRVETAWPDAALCDESENWLPNDLAADDFDFLNQRLGATRKNRQV